MSKKELKIKGTIILGNGITSIGVLENESKNPCILIGEIQQTKIDEAVEFNEHPYFEIVCKNSKGTKVLLNAAKAVYKALKKQEKELGLTK